MRLKRMILLLLTMELLIMFSMEFQGTYLLKALRMAIKALKDFETFFFNHKI